MKAPILLALASLTPSLAIAFDSRCYDEDGEECTEGPGAARNRWVGASDEHRELFDRSLIFAGVPSEVREAFTLPVFVGDGTVPIAGSIEDSIIPEAFGDVTRVHDRTHTAAEFAQLPDFGYSLWDWALGLETCPVDDVDAETCHAFKGHMGTLNSNHFLPQAQGFYRYYHQLALARAAECKAMSVALGPHAERFVEFLEACEDEALVLEAIGHHYLEDAWSSGHMWGRWGSPELADFPSLYRGFVVAATAGLIHGAKAVLQAGFIPEGILEFDDAMCAPAALVEWTDSDLEKNKMVGDLYLSALLDDDAYQAQREHFFSCAVSGIVEVYLASGAQHGALGLPTAPGGFSVDPTSDACFGQRVTNRGLWWGFGIDFTTFSGSPFHLDINPLIAANIVAAGAAFAADGTAVDGAQFGLDLVALSVQLDYNAIVHPHETALASGSLNSIVGVKPNDQYLKDPPASYVDPSLPWSASSATNTDPRVALSKTFHRAHAKDWCDTMSNTSVEYDLELLKARITTLTNAIEDPATSDPVKAELTRDRVAACGLCTEFGRRHLRIGTDESTYDPGPNASLEPLCFHIASAPAGVQYIYEPGSDSESPFRLAERWCGACSPPVDCSSIRTPDNAAELASLMGTRELYESLEIRSDTLTNLDALESLEIAHCPILIWNSPALASIAGLSALRQVEGSLQIQGLPALTSLTGLENLERVGRPMPYSDELRLSDLPNVSNLLPLAKLESGGSRITIDNLPEVTSLTGLENLRGTIALYLGRMPMLTDVTAIQGITTIDSLSVQEVGLTDLSGLSSLSGAVPGGLSIANNPNLVSLAGLEGLTSVADIITILANPSLSSLSGLTNITTFGGLTVFQNPALQSLGLPGLSGALGCNPSTNGRGAVDIQFNDSLVSLGGLENLTALEQLQISRNPMLTSVALPNLQSVGAGGCGGELIIEGNPSLSNVDLSGVNVAGNFQLIGAGALANINGLTNLNAAGSFFLNVNCCFSDVAPLGTLSVGGDLIVLSNCCFTDADAGAAAQSSAVGGGRNISGNTP